jgi:succinate dehydrogenase / fumarate reductase cytochrome b subunit
VYIVAPSFHAARQRGRDSPFTSEGTLMKLFSDSIGRKAVMAVTGLLMVLFVVGHLLGNLTIFVGADALNAYAEKLHALAPVVWGTRLVMGTAVLLHLVLSIQITMENSQAKPDKYAISRSLKATFASKNMIWTGVILGAFIVYHLLHFTFRVTPDVADFTGEVPGNVYAMVTTALHATLTGAAYVIAMVALFLHLSHGIQSLFQTLGLSNGVMLPRYGTAGKVVSFIFLVGFGAIPVAILAGLLAAA